MLASSPKQRKCFSKSAGLVTGEHFHLAYIQLCRHINIYDTKPLCFRASAITVLAVSASTWTWWNHVVRVIFGTLLFPVDFNYRICTKVKKDKKKRGWNFNFTFICFIGCYFVIDLHFKVHIQNVQTKTQALISLFQRKLEF